MRIYPIACMLLACCQGSERQPDREAAAPEETPGRPAEDAVRTAQLTGLYEGGGSTRNQLCILDEASGNARFGLVVWGGGQHSCSGSGSVIREGSRLRLTMAGDSSCTIDASISGGTISLPANVPAGCAYYCGARARLTGVTFKQTGKAARDAMKARDLVGEQLCADAPGA